ncbi:TniQ family protein [Herbaspirillum sp. NPDC087042]|uniref:TniQ family protein n=1 Tax=Herbaspirillum sp. NPDC087042 TaxID=3364004 RepID=UPI0037F917CB
MFLFRPQPLPGESLSSWRQRSGVANGFYRFPRPMGFRNFQEPDRRPQAAEEQWLKDEFRMADDILQPLFLDSIVLRLGRDFGSRARHRWVIPANGNRILGNGSTCCPICVSEDPMPYIRLSWRFAFMTHCPMHGCTLVERCTHCSAAMWPKSLKSAGQHNQYPFSHCQSCGGPILDTSTFDPLMRIIARELWMCASTGVVPASLGQAENAQEVFAALWALSQMLLRKRSVKAWDTLDRGLGESLRIWEGRRYIELLPVNVRAAVVRCSYQLLSDWPNTFADVATTIGLQRHHFAEHWDYQPIWLKVYIQKHLAGRSIEMT